MRGSVIRRTGEVLSLGTVEMPCCEGSITFREAGILG
jgi:hypothetical protein